MNLEIAVDPASVKDVSAFLVLASHLGFFEGRLISRFPSDWLRLAYLEIEDFCDLDRKRIAATLQRVKEQALVNSSREFDRRVSWATNVDLENQRKAFAEVYRWEEGKVGLPITSVFERCDWSKPLGQKVVGSIENFMVSLGLFLSVSGSVYLVDPYFSPVKKNTRDIFNAVLSAAFGNRCVEFKAYVRERDSCFVKGRAEKELRSMIDGSWGGSRRVTIVCFDDNTDESAQHARYIFSERGGFRLDRGLQTTRAPVDFSLVNKVVHEKLMTDYVERPVPFKVVFEISILV